MYADFKFYIEEYLNNTDIEELSQKDIEKGLREAAYDIDNICYGRIRAIGFDNLSEYQQELIKMANCYQKDFKKQYGNYLDTPLAGYSAGDISLSFKNENKSPNGIYGDKKVFDLLDRTGLTTRRL